MVGLHNNPRRGRNFVLWTKGTYGLAGSLLEPFFVQWLAVNHATSDPAPPPCSFAFDQRHGMVLLGGGAIV